MSLYYRVLCFQLAKNQIDNKVDHVHLYTSKRNFNRCIHEHLWFKIKQIPHEMGAR